MAITQDISAFPAAPDSATDTPSIFNTKANAFVAHQANVYVGEVNTWATQADALAVQVNADKVSAGNSAAAAALSETNSGVSEANAQTYAYGDPVGTGLTTKGAQQYSEDAAGSAAGVNLPPILPGDVGKILVVKATEDGYELVINQSGGGDLNGLTDVTITTPVTGDALVYDFAQGIWVNGKVLGMPNETNNLGKSVTTNGVEGDSFWSYVNTNPISMTTDQVMTAGTSASVVSGFTIEDGVTMTVPNGSVLSVV